VRERGRQRKREADRETETETEIERQQRGSCSAITQDSSFHFCGTYSLNFDVTDRAAQRFPQHCEYADCMRTAATLIVSVLKREVRGKERERDEERERERDEDRERERDEDRERERDEEARRSRREVEVRYSGFRI